MRTVAEQVALRLRVSLRLLRFIRVSIIPHTQRNFSAITDFAYHLCNFQRRLINTLQLQGRLQVDTAAKTTTKYYYYIHLNNHSFVLHFTVFLQLWLTEYNLQY